MEARVGKIGAGAISVFSVSSSEPVSESMSIAAQAGSSPTGSVASVASVVFSNLLIHRISLVTMTLPLGLTQYSFVPSYPTTLHCCPKLCHFPRRIFRTW